MSSKPFKTGSEAALAKPGSYNCSTWFLLTFSPYKYVWLLR